MKSILLRLVVVLLSLAWAVSASATHSDLDDADPPLLAPDVNLNDQVIGVQVSLDPSVSLLVTLLVPVSGGPFPLVIMAHGASDDPPNVPRISDNFTAYYFLSRGYAVALPLMRGYGGSEGHLPARGCDTVAAGLDVAKDLSVVIDTVRQLPGIDGSRIVVAGKSYGGWGALALGTLNVANVKGLVSFAGGMKEGDCSTPDAALISGAGKLGAQTKIPSIWFFGDNDKIFATATWQGMFKQYTGAGAHAELVDIGKFMDDAHTFTASGAALPSWVPKLDAFLGQLGLPNQPVLPIYMPGPPPPASHYAELNDVSAVPFLNDAQLAMYRRFLAVPLPRAIAIGRSGAFVAAGGFDASAAVLYACRKATQYCQLYAVDNAVVWPRLAPDHPATQFAALTDVSKVPYLNDRGRAGYADFLKSHRPRAFAVAPDGNWAAASGLDPVTDALVKCSQGHEGCKLYAIDGDVVWQGKGMTTTTALH